MGLQQAKEEARFKAEHHNDMNTLKRIAKSYKIHGDWNEIYNIGFHYALAILKLSPKECKEFAHGSVVLLIGREYGSEEQIRQEAVSAGVEFINN